MKKLLLSVLCLLGTALIGAFGATKLATFVGFDSNNLTQGSYTADLNGNSVNADGTVTIGTAPIKMTYSTWAGTTGISMLMKYSGLPMATDSALMTSFRGTADYVGCYVTPTNTVGRIWAAAAESNVGSVAIENSGYIILTHANNSYNQDVYTGDGTVVYSSSSTGGNYVGSPLCFGGKSDSTMVATNLVVHGVVVYSGVLSQSEITTAVGEYEAAENTTTLNGTTTTSALNSDFSDVKGFTLSVTGESTLTYDDALSATVLSIELGGDLTINVPSGSTWTQAGVISGTGKLIKTGEGTLILTSANTFTGGLYVNAGTVKGGGTSGNETPVFGYYNSSSSRLASGNLSTITVASGATLDIAGTLGVCYDITSNGGTIINSGAAIGSSSCQTTRLTLTADTTVGGSNQFGMLGRGYEATYINLNEHTLIKTNSNDFLLYKTTVTNATGAAQGTIRIDEGSVTLYNSNDLSGATISIGEDGSLVYSSATHTGVSVTGSGTVKLGTVRPTNAIAFEDGNNVTLSITLTDDTATSVEVACTGTPANVLVYTSAGTQYIVSPIDVTYDSDNSKLTLTFTDVADFVYTNPVTDETQTFDYEFTGAAGDGVWTNTENWYEYSSQKYLSFYGNGNGVAPYINNGTNYQGPYDPIVFSNKTYTFTTSIEGWNMKMGFFDNSTITINPNKMQTGLESNGAKSWFMVDETSKLTISPAISSILRATSFYVAASNGVEFASNLTAAPTFYYNLKGDGSVKFDGSANGTHVISNVVLNAYTTQPEGQSLPYGLVKGHPLLTVSSWNSSATVTPMTYAVVYFNNAFGEENLMSSTTYAAEAELTTTDATSENCGKYYIYSDTTGIYIDYIGYAEGAEPYPVGITIKVH